MSSAADQVNVRLQRAALDLFQERGYERTTAAQIAARARVTERTFFRYFPDKREVLFQGEAVLRAALIAALAKAPEALGPLDALFLAFRSVQGLLEGNRTFSEPLHEVIRKTPALQEREQTKLAALADALAIALKLRGATDLQALLAARTGMAAFALATVAWLEDPSLALGVRFDLAFGELRSMLSAPGVSPAGRAPARP